MLAQAFESRGVATDGRGVRDQAATWASYFGKSLKSHLPDHVTKGVLARLGARYRSDEALANALSTLLLGLPITQWDDAEVPKFRRQLGKTFDVIEETALSLGRTNGLDGGAMQGLASMVEARARSAVQQVASVVGRENALALLKEMAATISVQPEHTDRETVVD